MGSLVILNSAIFLGWRCTIRSQLMAFTVYTHCMQWMSVHSSASTAEPYLAIGQVSVSQAWWGCPSKGGMHIRVRAPVSGEVCAALQTRIRVECAAPLRWGIALATAPPPIPERGNLFVQLLDMPVRTFPAFSAENWTF